MTGYRERFPFDCMVCGDALETETVGGHASDFSSSGGEERYDPEQDAYFVSVERDEYRRVRRELADVEGTDELEGFLLHLKGRHVGPSGEKQPRCGIHHECTTTVSEHGDVPVSTVDAPASRYVVTLPLEDLVDAFPALGADALSVPDTDKTVTFQVERMEHYEDNLPSGLL